MTDAAATATDPYRLPTTVVPRRYELTLVPDLAAAVFGGTCAATVEVREPVTEIVCNAIELEIDAAWLEAADGTRIEAAAVTLDEDTERLTVTLASEAAAGEWVLHTTFTGVLNDKLHGFYRSTFTDDEGVEQVIATTQFEATDARRAFPCWDEPEAKAVFAVTLVVDGHLTALSNAAEVERTPSDDGKVAVRFADTMVMSTYLVAFIVGPLEVTDPVDVDGTPLRVAYPRGKGHLTPWALDVGAFCLRFFADYYGIPYPGDKCDLVAVPDFAFGAMENLGCITFRETALLVDPDHATQGELQRVTDVIAHELAHMWFGDLVTMKWWNGIWLNEAFATFMEMLATDAYKPEWDRWTDFGLSRTAAFDVDALRATRPVEYPVVSPDDAEGMFDILTYEKGAAVVRMLEQYLGADLFRAGIRQYLADNAYGNTETTDLWDALEAASSQPVRAIMDSWIFQGGFPLLDVELLHDDLRWPEPVLRIAQRRFGYASDLGEGDGPTEAEFEAARWQVPVIFSLETAPNPGEDAGVVTFEKVLLEGDVVDVDLEEPPVWVFANTEGTGFYRVHYAPELLEALAANAHRALSPVERYTLVDDAWASVVAGAASAVEFLELVRRFGDEDDLSVWERIIGALVFLDRLVDGDARAALQTVVRELAGPALERLGPEPTVGENDRTRELRGALLDVVGILGADDGARARARELLHRHHAEPGSVDPSLAAAAVAVVAATGGEDDFDDFVARFRSATNPQEEMRYLYALCAFDDAALVERVCAMTLTDAIRTQNAPYVLGRAMTNRHHGAVAWGFVQQHWEELGERFPSNSIVRMLDGVRSLHRPEVAETVFAFFETHEVPQGDKTLAQHLERLEVNVALRAREARHLAEHLTG
ncbi:MAG: M1 family metallopeptidase [Acidimicrobiales bacterium]